MPWVKAFHIIFMVTWFAGLFYLPRLFVYHAMTDDLTSRKRFKIMERKLFVMMTIGGVGTVFFGIWLLIGYAWQAFSNTGWLHTKLALVFVLILYHGYCWKLVQDFKHDKVAHSDKFFRWINEFPALILVAVVILVVVRPF